jgi:hypothetical protein
MSRAPWQLLTGWVAHPRPVGCPEMNFGRTLNKALKCSSLHAELATWSAITRDRPRWRLLTHPAQPAPSPPTPKSPTPSPPTPSPPAPTQPPANPNAPLPGYGNLAAAYVVPTWYAPQRRNAHRRPRRPLRFSRQPRQRSTSAAPSYARYRTRQLKKKILKTFTAISGCFVLGCQCFVARIYCDGHYFNWWSRVNSNLQAPFIAFRRS